MNTRRRGYYVKARNTSISKHGLFNLVIQKSGYIFDMSKTDFSQPLVMNYRDINEFLVDTFRHCKTQSGNTLTVRSWAKLLGYDSADVLIETLKQKRSLKLKHARLFEQFLGMNNDESLYFRTLIQFASADDLQKDYLNQILDRLRVPQIQKLEVNGTGIFSDWLDGALLEMSKLKEFKLSEKSASELLRKKIETTRISNRLDQLKKVGLLKEDQNGALKANQASVTTSNDLTQLEVQKYYQQVSELAADSAHTPVNEREFQCFSMAIQNDDLPRVKNLMREFRSKLEGFAAQSNAENIYQANLQFFPLTAERE